MISLRINLNQEAFKTTEVGSDLEADDWALRRKMALVTLFEKTGLIDSNQSALHRSQIDVADELSANDLSKIYSKASLIDQTLEKVEPRKGMRLTLRDYQKIALAFMLTKEIQNQNLNTTGLSPLWKELKTLENRKFYYSPFSGELSLEFPSEEHCQGGILADEMGLGKTIEMLSLIHTNRMTKSLTLPKNHIHSTLIICPLNLISQWRDEANRCFGSETDNAELYYGSERTKLNFKTQDCPFIVITTYGTLTSEYQEGNSPLFEMHWHRIVLGNTF